MTRTGRILWAAGVAIAATLTGLIALQIPIFDHFLRIHSWSLDRPGLLWLLPGLWTVALLLPLSRTDLPRAQQGFQALVRMMLLALLLLAAAGPRALHERPVPAQVVHVVDRSASVPEALLTAAKAGIASSRILAQNIESKQISLDQDERPVPVQVVVVDGRAVVLPQPATPTQIVELARDSSSERDTDLAAGVNAALALIDGHAVGHIVLWSDGLETRGDVLDLLAPLRLAGVHVELPRLPVLPALSEVLVQAVQVPPTVRANIAFPLAIRIQSTMPMRLQCRAQAGSADTGARVLTVPAGSSVQELGSLRIAKGGPAEITSQCSVIEGSDRFAGNNQLRTRIVVQERPKILYVEGAVGRSQYLARALVDDFDVTVLPEDGLPRTLGAMLAYRAIVLSDVPRVSPGGVPLVTDGDMHNLDAFVRQGGGLLVIGGENSLGSGGYQNTFLDKHTLPVRMDVQSTVQAPSLALMLCIDKSGSMQGTKMELAKEAARATAKALQADDRIGVIAFDSEARMAVRMQRASNSNRIDSDISRLQASGGTNIYPALDQAYQELLATDAKIKHVIVMTDGQAPRQGIDALVRQMRKAGITVSSVGVGTDVDRSLLEAVADRGGGRAWFTDRPETLPRIFVKETKMVTGQSVVDQAVHARVMPGLGRIDLLRGVHLEQAPALGGFVPTQVKAGAEELLRLSNGQPLLVRWRLGLGKSAVWSSDLKNRWAAAWLDWPGYAILSRQLVRDLLQEDLGTEVQVQLVREREQLRVAVEAIDGDEGPWRGLVGSAAITRPDGSKALVALAEVAPGHYEAQAPLSDFGPYDVLATLRAAPDKPVLAYGRATAIHPYPDEFRLPDPGQSSLEQLAQGSGGRLQTGPEDWLDSGGKTLQTHTPLWPDVVRLALWLLLVDVALRRVRLGRATATQWHALARSKVSGRDAQKP